MSIITGSIKMKSHILPQKRFAVDLNLAVCGTKGMTVSVCEPIRLATREKTKKLKIIF